MNGKPILLNFGGAEMSSDAGLTLLREVERRTDLAGVVTKCLPDPREPDKVRHSLRDIIRFRIMMIAAGYEDGNDADDLRDDPAFKLALAYPSSVMGRILSSAFLTDKSVTCAL